MVATIEIKQGYGGSDGSPSELPASGDVDQRLQTKDQYDPADSTYPVPIPPSGFKYSFWVHIYLKIAGGTFTKINNVQFYTDGTIGWSLGTNGEIRRGNRDSGDKGCPMDASYEKATGTDGDTGDTIEDATNGHGYYKGQTTKTTNIQSDVVGTPATIDSTDHTATGKCKAVVLQGKVASDATRGTKADETLTFKFNEI